MTATVERGSATVPMPSPEPSSPKKPRSPRPPGRLRSSTGKKAVMAVTGVVLVLYLVAHLTGNLKIFAGPEAVNEYAHWLRHLGEPALPGRTVLTLIEIVLAVSVVLHMWAAASLTRRARAARPVRYAARRRSRAQGYAARTMRWGGAIIALFVIWHLLDLTFAAVNPAGPAGLPYDRLVAGFAPTRWPVTAFYVIAMIMLGLHLRHGLWSAFQTLGLVRGRAHRPLRLAADVFSGLLILGFLTVPLAVTIGLVK